MFLINRIQLILHLSKLVLVGVGVVFFIGYRQSFFTLEIMDFPVFRSTVTPRPRLVDVPLTGDALGGDIFAHSTP